MFRHTQQLVLALVLLAVNIVVLSGECLATAPAIRLVVNPNKTDVALGSGPIALTARARGKNLTFSWELLGPGELDGKGSAVFYVLPEKIEGSSARALITVTVTDESAQEMTESVTFNLLAPPTPTPTLTPTPTPTPTPTRTPTSAFSLDDLKEAAKQEKAAKATWQATLNDMENAFSEVQEYEKEDISAKLKITAWERFLQAFSEDNPYSTRDEELRGTANERIRYWKEGGLPTPTPTPTALPPTPTPLPPTPTLRLPTPTPRPSEIEQLLKQADTYFEKRWFLTPEGTNAFDVYQEVLEIDPANRHAREKLHEMLRTYKAWGDSNYTKTNYPKAKTFYQRSLKIAQYMVEDLGDQSITREFQEVQKQLQELEATPTPSPTLTPQPPTPTPFPTPTPTPTPIPLRNEPLTVSNDEAQKVFGIDEKRRPLEYIENDFEDLGEIVTDQATGLMWQKSGSDTSLTYKEAQAYIEQLNRDRFAGYNDWRLPTIEELMSLLEPEKQSNGLYINPLFDAKQQWCWSADKRSPGPAWLVSFDDGYVYWGFLNYYYYVRAVRSLRPSTTTPRPPTPTPTPRISLRSKPLTVSDGETQKVFGLDENRRPRKYIENEFEDLGDTVPDYATGLMWQKSGSDKLLTYKEAQAYIEKLNRQRFAGYNDWRLPTVEELMSLVEPEKQSNGLYINPLFDAKQKWCWSADKRSPESAWLVYFHLGLVDRDHLLNVDYVRVVRS